MSISDSSYNHIAKFIFRPEKRANVLRTFIHRISAWTICSLVLSEEKETIKDIPGNKKFPIHAVYFSKLLWARFEQDCDLPLFF